MNAHLPFVTADLLLRIEEAGGVDYETLYNCCRCTVRDDRDGDAERCLRRGGCDAAASGGGA